MTPQLVYCHNCQQHRLCRRYKGIWLCLSSPGRCYRHRRQVIALMQHGAARRALAVGKGGIR